MLRLTAQRKLTTRPAEDKTQQHAAISNTTSTKVNQANMHYDQCGLQMSIYWEFPWVLWDSYENGNRQASFVRMEMEMGMV